MKPKEGYKGRSIVGVLILAVMISGVLIFNQWKLLQDLIGEKGSNMYLRYMHQNTYLNNLEKITAEIILTNNISKKTLKDIEELNESFLKITTRHEYYQPRNYLYGNFINKIGDYMLNRFIEETNDFFRAIYDNRIKLSDKNLEYLRNINSKANELNSIKDKYEFNIKKDNAKTFYSETFAKAINEMDESIDTMWLKELEYEKEDRERRNAKKPDIEKAYGKKFFSSDEARAAVEDFIGDFDEVKGKTDEDSNRYDKNISLAYIEFITVNGYRIEVTKQGGKIIEIDDEEWHDDLFRENKKIFDESQINISTEDAISKAVKFLRDRGINSLEVIYVDKLGPELNVGLAPRTNGYLNMAAKIHCELDLTRKGKWIRLSLDDYWAGLAYDDSGYDQAVDGYNNAKDALDPKIVVLDERLVGRRGEEASLDFYWRFTTEYDDDEYYINIKTGEKDVEKVRR